MVEDFAFANDDSGSAEGWVKAGTFKENAGIFANRDGQSGRSGHMNSDKSRIGLRLFRLKK